ncbi:tRNA guanosine(34) transglycosylase Tgt [Candidatus Woesebacteria bacterium]|nr:tRNA guanosine(34) transglycosylase Tgt [Candidatus Woesebacteria bacterium]
MFSFTIQHTDRGSRARYGMLKNSSRSIETPELAIVATKAQFKSIPQEYWSQLPVQYLIVNTFHLMTTQAGTLLQRIERSGDVHEFMGCEDKIIASDSGGFQVFSLGFGKKHNIGKVGREKFSSAHVDDSSPLSITEDGVAFAFDNKKIQLTPERSMEIQHAIGADIMFAFDECSSPYNSKKYTRAAMERTHRWLMRCIKSHQPFSNKQNLFGIIQGGEYEDLRKESARFLAKQNVSGFGIGGSLGSFKEDMYAVLDWVIPLLPEEKPRHFLGIGQVRDIFEGVERGVDLFDCVIPTREARHRVLYTHDKGKISIRKYKHLNDVLDSTCQCISCREKVTYRQLWQWFLEKDPRAPMYATMHNIWFYADLTRKIREAIQTNSLNELKELYYRIY